MSKRSFAYPQVVSSCLFPIALTKDVPRGKMALDPRAKYQKPSHHAVSLPFSRGESVKPKMIKIASSTNRHQEQWETQSFGNIQKMVVEKYQTRVHFRNQNYPNYSTSWKLPTEVTTLSVKIALESVVESEGIPILRGKSPSVIDWCELYGKL